MVTPLVLPDFPWDALRPYADTARRHPDGIVDLSVGTPVDPTPAVLQRTLAAAADAPGYPLTAGTRGLREAVVAWFARRRGVDGLDPQAVLPTLGSKELVAWLPTLLGIGRGDRVGVPSVAYPTYDIGARIAGAEPVVLDAADLRSPAAGGLTATAGPQGRHPALLWVNSPSNPTGAVLTIGELREVVRWARRHGVVVASDECYAELDWRDGADREGLDATPSILHPAVCDGRPDGLLAVYSLSKQSSLAGYRAGFVAGDPVLVDRLLQVRKHAGMIVPAPVQEVMTVALGDDAHVAEQRERYRARRERLAAALTGAGFVIDGSQAGLYLWARRADPERSDSWQIVEDLAQRGILVAPGSFYGVAGAGHVRVALTASDDRVAAAAQRLG